jgi:hypothetical protein
MSIEKRRRDLEISRILFSHKFLSFLLFREQRKNDRVRLATSNISDSLLLGSKRKVCVRSIKNKIIKSVHFFLVL